jgi:hypothetical protein
MFSLREHWFLIQPPPGLSQQIVSLQHFITADFIAKSSDIEITCMWDARSGVAEVEAFAAAGANRLLVPDTRLFLLYLLSNLT